MVKHQISKIQSIKGFKMTTIYRLYVNNQYVDYFTSLKRAKIEGRMHLSIGNSVTILEDNLDGIGPLTKVEL